MDIIAVDTGGTFTDLAGYDAASGRIVCAKRLTTYDDLVRGVGECVERAGADVSRSAYFKHGTTLVINALLQRHGSRAALVTTEGFRDVLEIARGSRPVPFDLFYRRDPALIPRELRFEIRERMAADGTSVAAPDRDEVRALAARLRENGIEAIGVFLLNSYINPEHEERVAGWLEEALPDVHVTASTQLSREWYEYERTATVAANAFVGPQMSGYLGRMASSLTDQGFAGRFFLMGSNGGVLAGSRAATAPVSLVESGPVGGCIGAAAYGQALGRERLIAFDMGGTTAKCALVNEGRFETKPVYYVGGYDTGFPIRGAVVDIVEVGAGGGSIAWLDAQGRLSVGPRSAGSEPGPVCYGRGGTEPTVTDANVMLGRLDPDGILGDDLRLDAAGARSAILEKIAAPLGYATSPEIAHIAEGILAIASVTMAGAIKRITVERGHDPRDFALFCYGGGGPLHAAQLARELHLPTVIVPPNPGNFSAIGMLLADVRRDDSVPFLKQLDEQGTAGIADTFEVLKESAVDGLREEAAGAEVVFDTQMEVRYRGQVHSVRVPFDSRATAASLRRSFEDIYRRRYGHADATNPAEIVSLQLTSHALIDRPDLSGLAIAAGAGSPPKRRKVYFDRSTGFVETEVYQRTGLPVGFTSAGPAVIEEFGSTTLIWPGDRFQVGTLGEISIEIGAADREGR